MSLQKDLSELLQAKVITPDTAQDIEAYYESKKGQSTNRLFIVFGILGAILIGLGIILIVAHNWDKLPRTSKAILAFIPMLIGQAACIFTLLKKPESIAWRESASAFLFFSVGACMALISQIYNLPGELAPFLFIWMLLCLPVVYVMRSSITSLLYLIGITYYGVEHGYGRDVITEQYWYWLLLLAGLPYYYLLVKNKPNSNFTSFHHWMVPLSLIITLGTVAEETWPLMFIAYFSLFGLFYTVGSFRFLNDQKLINNGYKIIGALGTVFLLLTLSFNWFWKDLRLESLQLNEVLTTPEFIASALISLLAAGLIYLKQRESPDSLPSIFSLVFLLFICFFIIGTHSPLAVVLINLTILAVGILTIRRGAQTAHLGLLNFGLLIITALIACRFFDSNLNFVIRGLLFVLVGAGFFIANYWMLKKRNTHEA